MQDFTLRVNVSRMRLGPGEGPWLVPLFTPSALSLRPQFMTFGHISYASISGLILMFYAQLLRLCVSLFDASTLGYMP